MIETMQEEVAKWRAMKDFVGDKVATYTTTTGCPSEGVRKRQRGGHGPL
jgi:hypothetical protein